jgi:predicted Zn-dependent protease
MSSTKRMKPIFNPFSNNSKNTRTNNRGRGRNGDSRTNKKQAIIAISLLLSGFGIWFLTPASDIIASFILLSIPIDEDVSLGRESWLQLRQKHAYISVPDQWGVSAIGNELARKIRNGSGSFCKKQMDMNMDYDYCRRQLRQYRWSFEVVSSREINAFALPGGIIRVTDSLLRQLQPTKGEIAALIGHEMGHVLHRHSQLKMVKQNLVNFILKSLVFEEGGDQQENSVGELLLTGALFLGEMRFSRKDEYEADSTSFDILVDSGVYHPMSVQSLLEKLWSFSGERQASSSSYIMDWDKTHPGTAERIEVLSKRWNDWSWHDKRVFQGRQR